jgi:hypothetical protein
MRAALPMLVLLLAGCGAPAPEPNSGLSATSSTTGVAVAANPAPVEELVPIVFDGKLGTSLHGCLFPTGTCDSVELVAAGSELVIERPGANFTGLDVIMSWTAQTPATETLTIGWMVMATCEGCNSTFYEEVSGASPLSARLADAAVPLTADTRFHIYAYNPRGLVYDPAVPGYAFVSVDQTFHIEGTATFVVSPA